MTQRVIIIAAVLATGCATTPRLPAPEAAPVLATVPLRAMHTREATLANRFRLCADACPQRTPKTLVTAPIAPTSVAQIAAPAPMPIAEPIASSPAPGQVDPVAGLAPLAALSSAPAPATPLGTVAIRFALASTTIDATARRTLAAVVIDLNTDRAARRLEIHGRTDDLGSQASNDRLAAARGIAVRNALRELGLRSDIDITVRSQGKCCYRADNATAAGRQQNRRADVVLFGGNAS